MIKGIDVSRWQNSINWPILKGNVDFVMIKLGGSDDGFYMDGMAQRNVIEARSADIPIGFYFYLGGSHTVPEEVQHIKNLVAQIGGLKPGEPVALDWEEHHATDEVGYVAGIASGLINAGFPAPLFYASLNRILGNRWQPLVDLGCGLWVAAWGNNDTVPQDNEVPNSEEWPFWALWQYSSNGTVAGIPARVDLDMFSGDIDHFKAYGLKGGLMLTTPVPVPAPHIIPAAVYEYVVQPSDNLSVIAARYGHSWQDLYALNRDRIAQPNRIYPGQKLRVWASVVGQPVNNPPLPTSTHRTHTVENGENLSVIASKFGLPNWQVLYEANRQIIGGDPNFIKPGQVLTIP